MTEPVTHTLEVPGAVLAYDVRPANGFSTAPTLLMIGSPMGAAGFGTLSGHFTDRMVVTYDPRGVERSTLTGDAEPATPMTHADDLHRLTTVLGTGAVDVFASSGGAVNALAWVEREPDDIETLVAHEPPLPHVLEDRDAVLAVWADIHDTYQRAGLGPGMAKFIGAAGHQGLFGPEYLDQPAPDPAMFGLPTEDDGSRDDPLLGVNLATLPDYVPNFEALDAASTRILPAIGAESQGEMAHRGGLGVAERLGVEAVVFPSGHGGFLGGEYGQTGDPDAFASRLREVLADHGTTR